MPNGTRKSKRSERVASLELPPGQWERAWNNLRRRDVLGRIALALLAAAVICVVIRGWDPPDPRHRLHAGYVPPRDIVAAVPFTKADPVATAAARERARSEALYVYEQDAEPLIRLHAQLRNTLAELTAAASLDKLDPIIWQQFQPPSGEGAKPPSAEERKKQFLEFREAFTPQEKLDKVANAVAEVFAPFEEHGLLDKLEQDLGPGNQNEIVVYPKGRRDLRQVFQVADVLIGDGTSIRDALRRREELEGTADRLFAWLSPKLKPTLRRDDRLTKENMAEAEAEVPGVLIRYSVGQTLAKGGQALNKDQIELLGLEYWAALQLRHAKHVGKMIVRSVAVTGLIFAALVLCGIYMRYRQRGPLVGLTRLLVLLSLAVAAVALARWLSDDPLRGEIAPVLLFGMTMAVVYRRALALLLSSVVALAVVLAVGQGLQELFLLMGALAAAILNLEHIRTSTKLIYVGMFAGAVACLLQLGMGIIDNQPVTLSLLKHSFYTGLWALGASFFMFGLLRFVERLFGVLTDLSLLQLGDVAHPLLQELVRRAPSTYNHSVTVGSIAEAAAESIHARGLLVRVGAYFHDIGKMLKPDYFVENQEPDQSRHEKLAPAMSTLVIFAHIKDGADLARQHRLPQPIIDLIVQHHGTTRVEYFYDRATERQQSDPNGGEVDESTYRYPGPKPQTKEAAVLMLADAVESASRTLVDPAPARIEGLVRDISEQRLRDGQFDESGLTLRELRTIEKSLAMSLTS
ncbi:MAG: HDIG domain-containing protein, partial [Pirellulales bacterium]|nr:HDIG domain-containing protein [Pirellulales bacterium]